MEKRKLDKAIKEVRSFLDINGIKRELREELLEASKKEKLLRCLPETKRDCTDFELNCYYIMFKRKLD